MAAHAVGSIVGGRPLVAAAAVARENLSEVQRLRMAELMNLLAAIEAVGYDDGGGSGGADGRQQAVFRDGF